MSYRIQIDLEERDPLKEKVLLHAKFLRHFQRRKMDKDARGRTNWAMEFISERGHFTIIWTRRTKAIKGELRYQTERFMGLVVIKFSKSDIDTGGSMIVMGDWPAIEDHILRQEKVS